MFKLKLNFNVYGQTRAKLTINNQRKIGIFNYICNNNTITFFA